MHNGDMFCWPFMCVHSQYFALALKPCCFPCRPRTSFHQCTSPFSMPASGSSCWKRSNEEEDWLWSGMFCSPQVPPSWKQDQPLFFKTLTRGTGSKMSPPQARGRDTKGEDMQRCLFCVSFHTGCQTLLCKMVRRCEDRWTARRLLRWSFVRCAKHYVAGQCFCAH